jgi:hypothetical protein
LLVWRYHVRRGNRTTAVCALAPKRNAIPYDHPMYTSFLIRSFVNMPSMFVLVSCLDHLERHQPLGLDRNHQIVKHVCESFCKVAIRQQRSPFFIVIQMLSVCTFLSGVGVLCFLGSSGAGSQANLFVQPCLANMAWSIFCFTVLSSLPFEQIFGGAGDFRRHSLSTCIHARLYRRDFMERNVFISLARLAT